jgi:hypothetical protein
MGTIASQVTNEKLAAEAMARVAPDAAALSVDELTQVNLDLQAATGTILGVLPEVMALREQLIKELPSFDITLLDKLEDYALALRFAHAAYQTATKPPDDLQELADEATARRQRLLADATALSFHGLVDPRKLESLKGANGIKNIAQDLQMLSHILQESWPEIQGKCGTTAEDLQAASRMGTRLTRIVGLREQGPLQEPAVVEQRDRVFKLTMRAYDETRAAVAYVRRRIGDVDSIMPSLYKNSGKARPRSDTTPSTDGSALDGGQATGAGESTTTSSSAVPPEQVAAGVAAHKGTSGSKGPFLS